MKSLALNEKLEKAIEAGSYVLLDKILEKCPNSEVLVDAFCMSMKVKRYDFTFYILDKMDPIIDEFPDSWKLIIAGAASTNDEIKAKVETMSFDMMMKIHMFLEKRQCQYEIR